jgi:hypothetical protein
MAFLIERISGGVALIDKLISNVVFIPGVVTLLFLAATRIKMRNEERKI